MKIMGYFKLDLLLSGRSLRISLRSRHWDDSLTKVYVCITTVHPFTCGSGMRMYDHGWKAASELEDVVVLG